ncbi:MAG: PilZ domain-containing protein [Proteobacteria bacterium]|nr:PilZ domain-containing protein [Pseudomonadota bacterium]
MTEESVLTHQPFGYRKKPARVYLAAAYLLIAPFINLVLGIRNTGEVNWYKIGTWFQYLLILHPRTWALLIITLTAGGLLLLVRKASWVFTLASLGLVILYNLIVFHDVPLLAVALLAFVAFTPFKKPYLNPSLRWWEHPPRFVVDLFAAIPEIQAQLKIFDVSEGGMLAAFEGSFVPSVGATFYLEFNNGPKVMGKVVRKQEEKYLGIHFESVDRKKRRELRDFIKGLERRGEAKAKR